MRTPIQYHNREPFSVSGNVVLFHDWRHVNHGYPGWVNAEEQPMPLFGEGPLPATHFNRGDIPYGVRLQAYPAERTAPVLQPERPWEGLIFSPTVLYEDGRYRLWYESVAPNAMSERALPGHHNLLCYAESTDGVTWTRPDYDLLAYEGHARTNIVFGGELAGPHGFHGSGVFRDDAAPVAERYKVIYLGFITPEEATAFAAKYPDASAPLPDGSIVWALCGATSPDGLHWTPLPEPLCLHMSDTANNCYYDAQRGAYVAFVRTWVMGRRSIGRMESADFRRFPLPETIRWPGADVGATDTWYGNGKTVYPGTTDYHLLFPHRWQIADDRFYVHLFTSPDGALWSAPPDNLVLPPTTPGMWDSGAVSMGCGLVELPGGRVGGLYTGYRVPHKHPRRVPLGALGWAWWPRDRLVGLVADEVGEFSTWLLDVTGDTLHLNARTAHAGAVRVEVLGADRRPLPGRTLADCDPITGDHPDAVVQWRGDARLTPDGTQPLGFHVQLARAELFSLRFS
jgi:hypothetical protein